MDVVDEVLRRGGIVWRGTLARRAVSRALSQGRLVAPRRGIIAHPSLEPGLLAAVAAGGVLSCASAAQALGLELLQTPAQRHVTLPRGVRGTPGTGMVLHTRDVPSLDGATTPSRTAADCARCLREVDAVVVVDQVLARGVTLDEVMAHLHGPGSSQARRAVARAAPGSGSSGETCARLAIEGAGLSVEPQVLISGVGWVDLLVEGRVVVEIDGYAYHCDPRQFAKDRRRDAALVGQGYVVLRFTWSDAVNRPAYVVASVLAALAAH